MDRASLGSSAREAEGYLVSVFSTCTGFELAVVTSAEVASRKWLREQLAAVGAEIIMVSPDLEQVLGARHTGPELEGHRSFVLWIESETDDDDQRWRELVAALNRSRQRLMNQHRYLWVMAGPYSLRRIMTRQGQDLYSGAYKVPHVVAHAGAEVRWLHLSDLQLGAEEHGRGPRQGGDVWRSVEGLLLPDLARLMDDMGAGPDLVLVSGDLGATGQPADYEHVDRFFDRVLDELERRGGRRPVLLAVPGNHDVRRPGDPVEIWPFLMLRLHDEGGDLEPFVQSLREHLWVRKDARVVEPLFAGYTQWARRHVLALQPDELGMEAGVAYVRSVNCSHIPGDWSVLVEKDDFRLGIVGVNTAWTSFDDDVRAGDVLLPLEQLHAALGSSGSWRSVDDVHQSLLVTHHGPEWLSSASSAALEGIRPLARFAAQVCGPRFAGVDGRSDGPAGSVQRGYPLFAWGIAQQGRPSGYRLGRIGRDGRVDSRIRVLEPIPARGAWRYVDGVEVDTRRAVAVEEGREPSWWPDALRRYLDLLVSRHDVVSLMGFETRLRIPLRLDELYVPLDAVIDLEHSARRVFDSAVDAEAGHEGLSMRGHEVALVDAFASAARMGRRGIVILGDPGSGKTMQLERMLLKVVQDGPESMGLPAGTVPVFLRLRALRSFEQTLEAFVTEQLDEFDLPDVGAFVHALVNDHRKVWYLFDGLDEVAGPDLRENVSRWIDRQLDLHPEAWITVTSRYAGYRLDTRLSGRFLELHLRPLTDEQVERFVRQWFTLVETAFVAPSERADAERRANARADALMRELREPDVRAVARVYAFTRNPLLLTAICLVHRDRGRLPDRRAELYDECISVLLETWNRAKHLPVAISAKQARAVLQPVARWMHDEDGRTHAAAAELEPELRKAMAGAGLAMEPRAFLTSIRDQSGLLTGWSADEYGFMHLGFQEYLTARELRNQEIVAPGPFRELASRFGDSWWQEVILLMLAQDDPPLFDRFMREVVARPEFVEWSGSWMMGLCLQEAAGVSERPFVEMLRVPSGRGVEERQLAAARVLVMAMPAVVSEVEQLLSEHPAPAVRSLWAEHVRRHGSGREVLVAQRGGVDLVLVPAGRSSMGSNEGDEQARDDERPRHQVELASFYLARAPVTNAQYREYLKANPGVREPDHWGDRRLNRDEQPVIGVSWHDATVYCDWAGLVLPTEAQWEYACRAGTTTRYWSGDGEEDLAAVGWYDANSGKRLHAVAEREASPWGLHDMHGNVWEWCRDAHEPYTTSARVGDGSRGAPQGDVVRVIRGGSWRDDARHARSACRLGALPNLRHTGLGFRPALILP